MSTWALTYDDKFRFRICINKGCKNKEKEETKKEKEVKKIFREY